MGQYLALGIATNCAISKEALEKHSISKQELITTMEQEGYFVPSIFNFVETPQVYALELKPEVLHAQLLPFLEKLYPILYAEEVAEYQEVLELLRTTSPDDWHEIATFECFQIDAYGESEYLHFDKPNRSRIRLSFNQIFMLSLEGKISMECYGRQFAFFKYCIQQAFADFSLAKAIRVYITG